MSAASALFECCFRDWEMLKCHDGRTYLRKTDRNQRASISKVPKCKQKNKPQGTPALFPLKVLTCFQKDVSLHVLLKSLRSKHNLCLTKQTVY